MLAPEYRPIAVLPVYLRKGAKRSRIPECFPGPIIATRSILGKAPDSSRRKHCSRSEECRQTLGPSRLLTARSKRLRVGRLPAQFDGDLTLEGKVKRIAQLLSTIFSHIPRSTYTGSGRGASGEPNEDRIGAPGSHFLPGSALANLSRAMDKVVLITGSSTGFGRATAELLGRHGYTVFATMRETLGRNSKHREALESLASKEKLPIQVVEMDVSKDTSVSAGIEQILERAGRIDVVINNAGVAALGITEAYTVQKIQELFEVNFFGVVRVNRAVLPTMRRQRSGLLIHVSSAAGRIVVAYFGIYSASKFALEALADSYRFELAPFGVDSVLVEPGIHRTPILEAFQPPDDESRAAEYHPDGDFTSRLKAVFDSASASPETPGSEEVAEAFLQLIEMPAGTRPFRTVPTAAVAPLLEPYNTAATQIRQTVAQMFNTPELATLKSSNS